MKSLIVLVFALVSFAASAQDTGKVYKCSVEKGCPRRALCIGYGFKVELKSSGAVLVTDDTSFGSMKISTVTTKGEEDEDKIISIVGTNYAGDFFAQLRLGKTGLKKSGLYVDVWGKDKIICSPADEN